MHILNLIILSSDLHSSFPPLLTHSSPAQDPYIYPTGNVHQSDLYTLESTMILLALQAHQWVRQLTTSQELTLNVCSSSTTNPPTYSVAPEEPNVTAVLKWKV